MIEPMYNKILVQVNLEQKDYAEIGGVKLFLAPKFNPNNREKNPVIAQVLKGKNEIKEGQFIVVHHNYFSDYSPYEISDGIYSIPYSENIFAIIDKWGNPQAVCGNIIAERLFEDEAIGIANVKRLHYHDRVKVISNDFGYVEGDEIFTLPYSDYEIVYNWNGIERRIIRVFKENIVAILQN